MVSSRFALALGVRAVIFGALCVALAELLMHTRMYVLSLFVAVMAIGVLVNLGRSVLTADRALAHFVDHLAASEFSRSTLAVAGGQGFENLAAAIDRAIQVLNDSRATQQRQVEQVRALLDNVSTVLLTVEEDGSIHPANRAARKRAAKGVRQLTDLGLPAHAAELIGGLPAGQRAVVRLEGGERVLVSVAQIKTTQSTRRLISLQDIEGELDAAEINAWQNLVRVLAHEMMSSLTPVSSLAESVEPLLARVAAASPDPLTRTLLDEITESVQTIRRRSVGLMSFIEHYRKVARVPRPHLRSVPAAELIRRIDRLMSATFALGNVRYTSHVMPDTLEILADADLLEQALINLLHNAIEATASSTAPCVELSCEARDEEVVIAVRDNGQGVDPHMLDRIFVPFFTTKRGGSGIGLTLVRQIARAHDGQIDVGSCKPRGAVFSLRLPVGASGVDGACKTIS
jgi:nitrogen fixation/metabolism regulation signal transduction histidine kinase